MTTTNDRHISNGTTTNSLHRLNEWLSTIRTNPTSNLQLNFNAKLNAEIHFAIVEQTEKYASSICDHLFTLYRQVSHRQSVLQFLPSFITAYYDVLHHQHHHHHQRSHPEFVDAQTKDVYSTIDTFLVSLYSLGVLDYRHDEAKYEIQIPNLTQPSIYHVPNIDCYTPLPLTRTAISRHENKQNIIRPCSFAPFDSVNTLDREQILRFLLIQYGKNVSVMDEISARSFVRMSTKLVSQGFPFAPRSTETSEKIKSRRIHLSSPIMTEILGTLIYIKTGWRSEAAVEAMRLIKKRAEYELFTDVMLMTESLESLHEFQIAQDVEHDRIGIEIEIPANAEIIRQKRSAKTNRSMKNRIRTTKFDDSISDENNATDTSVMTADNNSEPTARRRVVLNAADNNPIVVEPKLNVKNQADLEISPTIDESRTFISSSIGPATSSPSPTVGARIKSSYIRGMSPSTSKSPVKNDQDKRSKESGRSFQTTVAMIHQENPLERSQSSDFEETYL